jgi:ATP-binding cassette subfamily C (CFTR/MRP) protein 1
MVAAIAIGLISLAVSLRGTTSGGAIGVALNIVLKANTTLLRLVESWTSLETSLSAISRLKALQKNTPSEDETDEICEPPEYWPSAGRIALHDVGAYYK